MVVQHNLQAMNTNRQLGLTINGQSKSTEKLSSGYKINRAADDAAGLAISEKMRSQIKGLDKASTNASDGISVVQTAEGALNEVHSILQRMNELATQAANDTNTSVDRSQLKLEINQLASEIDRISSTTQFNTMNLLDGSFIEKNLQVGALSGQRIEISINAISSAGLGLTAKTDAFLDYTNDGANDGIIKVMDDEVAKINKADFTNIDRTQNQVVNETNNVYGSGGEVELAANDGPNNTVGKGTLDQSLKVSTFAAAGVTMKIVQNAIDLVSTQRANLGAVQNRLEHTIANLDTTSENTSAAESRVRDTDMAKEMVTYSKNNILAQAGQSMLAQANQSTQGVLSLL
ncbi:MAG: flagellin [Lachnospiraceae bacterium]|nr:flagellin [Lachnospiraceae bacterium]